jgi:uncharacterized protein (DUF58 family)
VSSLLKHSSADGLFDEAFLASLEYLEIVAKRAFQGASRGERRSRRLGAGLEFADHRRYSPGDDFRHIDWNVYARLGKLLLRLFDEEEDLTVYLLVDASASMGLGDGARFDQARRLAAALAYVSLANLDRVSLVGLSDRVSERLLPARGKAQIFHVLRFLSELKPAGETRLGDAIQSFVHQAPRRGLAILVSDLYSQDGVESAVNALRYHRFEPAVLHLTDQRELELGLRGDLRLVDCETGAHRDVTMTPRLMSRYREAHAAWRQGIETFCTQRQVPYFQAPVETSFQDIVLKIFHAGGLVR